MAPMSEPSEQGGEAPCWAHLIDDLDQPPPPSVVRSNTIVYSARWSDTVAFYRDVIGLRPTMERDWFVEFELHPGAHLSVADAGRATIAAGDGAGITLSWRVDDLDAMRARLTVAGVEFSATVTRWGAECFHLVDPSGNRIEFWADAPQDPQGASAPAVS